MKYLIPRDEHGRRTGHPPIPQPEMEEEAIGTVRPVSTTLPSSRGETKEVLQCTICEQKGKVRQFILPAHFSNHLRQSHPEVYEDKYSWKTYGRKVIIERKTGRV